MNNQPLFIDINCFQEKNHDYNVCGDSFFCKRYPDEGRVIAVLSDGLGSGIKANILSQMTSTMLLKFIAEKKDILKASEIIMDSLPVCNVRKISYSTFSAVDSDENGITTIVEEGNPNFIWIRNNEILDTEAKMITSKKYQSRCLNTYRIQLEPEDRLIFCSDGVTQAGIGSREYKLGWRRKGLAEFIQEKLLNNPKISSRELSSIIARAAQKKEPQQQAKDDISAAVLYFRNPRKCMVFTGPPYYSERDGEYAKMLIDFDGKKAICGGTTANLVSRELGRAIATDKSVHGNLPGISYMEGIDLVTEGILTLTKAVEYLEERKFNEHDAAGKLVHFLLESDCIEFMVGAKLNQAHYDPNLPVELEIRKTVIKRITRLLEENYVKNVKLQFI